MYTLYRLRKGPAFSVNIINYFPSSFRITCLLPWLQYIYVHIIQIPFNKLLPILLQNHSFTYTTYYFLLLPTTSYYFLLLPTTSYFFLLLRTTSYYFVLLPTTSYYFLLLHTTSYYFILLYTTLYYFILLHTHSILLPTTSYYFLLLPNTSYYFHVPSLDVSLLTIS